MPHSEIIINLPFSLSPAANSSTLNNQPRQRLIGALEETSLMALLDYIADQLNRTAADVTRCFYDRFSIPTLTALPASQFDDAVKYLVDQVPDDSALAEG